MIKVVTSVIFLSINIFASIEGDINLNNNHWGAGGNVPSPIVITSTIKVPKDITLTIEPGTEVICNDAEIFIDQGKISANGAVNNFIVFKSNSNSQRWGGISIKNSKNSSMSFCKIINTRFSLQVFESESLAINNCLIHDFFNEALYIENCTNFKIFNITVFNTSIFHTQAMTINSATGILKNSIFNLLKSSVAPYYCFGQSVVGGGFNIFNAEVAPNCNLSNDIKADPLFVDPENGDFHLQPNSPAIDAGDPTDDFSLEPSGGGGRINMGAYGNTPEATLKGASVKHQLKIKTSTGKIKSVSLFDAKGRLINKANSKSTLKNSKLKPGIYFYHIVGTKSETKEKFTIIN